MKLGVFAIILNKKHEFLLVKRNDKPMWNLVGGGVRKGEDPKRALIREVKEEIRAKITKKTLVKAYFYKQRDELVLVYLVKLSKFTFKPTKEAKEAGWFSIKKLPRNTFALHKRRIRDVINRN